MKNIHNMTGHNMHPIPLTIILSTYYIIHESYMCNLLDLGLSSVEILLY